MANKLMRFGPNTQGRDFVIGDMHGSYSCFENLIRHIGFDPITDRMFSVGDLIDRGPDSTNCLALIREPWFHTVICNHGQLMIEKFRGGYMGQYWYHNGGSWAMEAVNDYTSPGRIPSDWSQGIIDSVDLLEQRPYLISIDHKNGKRFHIVHAELPFTYNGRPLTDQDLEDELTVADLATIQTMDGDYFLWSRYHFGAFYRKKAERIPEIVDQFKSHRAELPECPDLSHVISGHTIVCQPITHAGRTNIDTGAYLSYFKPATPYGSGAVLPEEWAGLTCINLDTWEFYKATETQVCPTAPYMV